MFPPSSSLSATQKQEVSQLVQRTVLRDAEHKFTLPGQSLAVTASFQYTQITAISQAVSDSDRTGDALKIIGDMELQYSVEKNAASTIPADHVRLVIFQWYQNTSSTTPTDAVLWLQDPSTSSVTYRSMESHDFGKQSKAPVFRILYDQTTDLIGLPATPTEKMSYYYKLIVPLSSMRRNLQYSAASNNGMNQLYVAWIGTTATAPPALNFEARLQYIDM